MRFNLSVEQAIVTLAPDGPDIRARSAGVTPRLEAALGDLAAASGAAGPPDTDAVFAYPVTRRQVAVATVRGDRFRFLVWDQATYDRLGDPFQLAAAFPPDFAATGELPTLAWPDQPLPPRIPAGLLAQLKSGDSPLLLGATQALLDGARLRLAAADAPAGTLEAVWELLPDRTRCELWPSTRATAGTTLAFHAAVTDSAGPPPVGTLSGEMARDYPEGKYEFALQSAIESGDQAELDALLARRSSRDTLRLAAGMVLVALAGAAGLKLAG